MFDTLPSLSTSISRLWASLAAGKKRRVTVSRFAALNIEDLEARQMLSATDSDHVHGGVPRIINGTNTSSFTAVGTATYTPTGGTAIQSTATLIATQWVLTSASASSGLTTTGGAATVNINGTNYTVDQIVTYPKYKSSSLELKQDIALWHITSAVPNTVTPVSYSYTKPSTNVTVTLVGYGLTGNGTTGATGTFGTKQTATTKLTRVSPSLLSWRLDNNSEGTTAAGDRGGPVLATIGGVQTIVGVVSSNSTSNSVIGDNAYNTRVDLYAGWIDNTIGRTHPTSTVADDYVDVADTVGTTNRTFNLSASATSFSVHGKLSQYGDVDVFKVVTAVSGYATFTLGNYLASTSLLDTKLEVYASNGTTLLYSSDDVSGTDLTSKITTALAAGTYYVKVSTYGNYGKGEYNLTVKDTVDNVGGTTATATTLTGTSLGVFSTAFVINSTTDVDYYKVTVTKAGNYQFDCTHDTSGTLDPTISIYNSTGTLLGTNDNYITGGVDSRYVIDSVSANTVFYIAVSGVSGSAGFGHLTIRKTT